MAAAQATVSAEATSGAAAESGTASRDPRGPARLRFPWITAAITAIVNRLQIEEKLIEADEHWKDEKALPLPSQMLRMGSELVAEKDIGVSYALLSLWPINKQNGAN